MAKITRYNGNLEAPASAALGTERTIFGTGSQSDDLTDQFNAFLLRGWGIVGPSDQPTLQDFNAMGFTLGQIHAYLHQMGVAEYNAAQEYHIGSITNVAGVLYVSLVDTNVGNAPASSPAQWRELYPQATTSARGSVELATSAEMATGTSTILVPPVSAIISLFSKVSFASADFIRVPDRPGGLLIQWGSVPAIASGSSATVNHPTPFVNAIRAFIPVSGAGASGTTPICLAVDSAGSPSPLVQTIVRNRSTVASEIGFFIAIGN